MKVFHEITLRMNQLYTLTLIGNPDLMNQFENESIKNEYI